MPHITEIRVAWGDTDAGGLIYFPRFFHYLVVGLNDYFTPATDDGHLMEQLRTDGHVLPAIDASASFSAPLRAGDTARIETRVTPGETSLRVEFEVGRAAAETAAAGEVTFVLVDETFTPTPLPESVRECVRAQGDGSAPT